MAKRKKIEKIETGSNMDGSNFGGNRPNIKRVRQNSPNAPEYPPTHGGLLGTQQIDWKKDKGKTPTGRGGSGSHNMVNRKTRIIEDMIKEGDGGGGDGGGSNGGFGDGGGTVFTSTNAGIFNPTYGGKGKKPRVRSKKKRTGIERLGVFLTDGSPEKKMRKSMIDALQNWVEQSKNILVKEEPPKVIEHDSSPDRQAATKQKDMEAKIAGLDESTKRSGEHKEPPTGHVAPHVMDVKLSKQPQAFGNPQDDELKRGAKKDDSKWADSLELELEKFIEELRKDSALYTSQEEIDIIKSAGKMAEILLRTD